MPAMGENNQMKNDDLKMQYDALHNKYNTLQENYDNMVKKLSFIEAQSQIPPPATQISSDPTAKDRMVTTGTARSTSLEEMVSEMKGDAMKASQSISELQEVWSYAESKLQEFSYRINNTDQYMKKNSLLIRGLKDIPKKTYGLAFSKYIIGKLKNLLPTIADSLRVEDIDVSHPLPTRNKFKSCVIVKFVRRDIKNLIFFGKGS